MLRTFLLVAGMGLTVTGLGLEFAKVSGAGQVLGGGCVLTLAVIFERWRYRSGASTGGAWQPTGERFIDPESGQPMQVWFDPQTGARRYQALPPGSGPAKAP